MTRAPISLIRQVGFTLIEVIVTLVVLGIVSSIIAMFMRVPAQNYLDAVERAELSDVADTAVRRVVRELRLAVPNSVRVNATKTVVEFVPTKAGGRYLSASDAQDPVNPILDFDNAAKLSFTAVGTMPIGRQAITAGDSIVVYNIGEAPGDVYSGGNRASVGSVVGQIVNISTNPFALQNPELAHPAHRFLVATTPVTYRCAPPSLFRHSGYGFNATMVDNPGGTTAVLASNVAGCTFERTTLANSTTASLTVTLVLTRAGSTDADTALVQQIHINNDP
ncbi:MAG: type II secretion system protein [Pseudomonadota bacterium]